MKMQTVDSIKLIIEMIYNDYYLKMFFEQQLLVLKNTLLLDDVTKDFAAFRKSIIDERIAAKEKKLPLLEVTRTITL